MRLRQLQIQRYGHFVDATLDLPGNGLQVIHGHNEAGKSTLLQFIRELLFGYAERNKYSFGDGKLEGSGRLEFKDGDAFELRRRKGRPDTLTAIRGGVPEAMLEADLQRLLGGANHQLFHNVFAFGLYELASGEESLRIEAVQNALHGSGSGGMKNPQKILDQLTKESEAIFKKNGKLQVVTVLCKEIKEGITELKKKTTKTDTFLQLRREFEAAKQIAEQHAEQLTVVRREQGQVKKLVTAYPLWRELQELSERRQQFGELPHLATDARQKFDKLLEELKRVTKDLGKIDREIQNADAELAAIPVQTEWLALRAQIEQARELIKSVQDARRDLPLLESDLAQTTRTVEQGLRDAISDWTVDQLRGFRCDQNQRFQCEEFVEKKRQLETERIRLSERQADLLQDQAEASAELESIGEIPDVSRLQNLIARQSDSLAWDAEIERLTKQARAIVTQTRKLSPPLPSGLADVATLPVPPREEIQIYQQRLQQAQEQVSSATRSLDEAQTRHEQLRQELQAARGSHLEELPHREGLRQRRELRNGYWTRIENSLVAGHTDETVDSGQNELEQNQIRPAEEGPTPSTALFWSSMVETDRYADALFDNASLVTKQEQVDAANAFVESREQELLRHQTAMTELRAQWNRLWLPCGFEPLDPSTMLQWHTHHSNLLELNSKLEELHDDLARFKLKSETFQAELFAELPESSTNLKTCLEAAQQRITHAQQLTQELKNTQKTLVKLAKQSELLKQDQARFSASAAEFHDHWQAWLSGMAFSTAWQPEQALDTINRLQHLQGKLELIPGLDDRIAAIRTRLSEFDPMVTALCDAVALEWKTLPTEVAARSLDDRLQSAITTHQRRNELTRELTKNQNKRAELHQQHVAAMGQQKGWFDAVHVETEQQFWEEVQRAETIRDLDRQIDVKQRQLDVARDSEDESRFLQQLQAMDFPEARQKLDALESKLSALAEQERQANQEKGAKENECAKLDGSSAAAEIQGQVTNRRAALSNAVDRYVPLLFAQELLQQTLKRFERESQPEMLGEVSRLFATMTGDRYVRVERPRDHSRPLLVYRANGQDLEPADLSMGTREQLYLSIRLAYVLHYCSRAEPLPVVLDDVFANFDPGRTRRTLEALGNVVDQVQILLFTCHPHVVELAQDVFPDLKPVEVPGVLVKGGSIAGS